MKRREFLLSLAGAVAGVVVPDIFRPKSTEAAIEIYRGAARDYDDPIDGVMVMRGNDVDDRPQHPFSASKGNPEEVTIPTGNTFYESRQLSTPIEETYLNFGPLENRLRTDMIVVHHIGNTDADVSAATVHQWHLNQGWSGIGYHFLIRKDGTIERGRPMDVVGAHAYGENSHTIGVNIVGNFEEAIPTGAQMESAARLIAELCSVYRIRPSARSIVGHRDVGSTACPGRTLYMRLPTLRQMVINNMEQ